MRLVRFSVLELKTDVVEGTYRVNCRWETTNCYRLVNFDHVKEVTFSKSYGIDTADLWYEIPRNGCDGTFTTVLASELLQAWTSGGLA